jgi:CRISPR/Cas system-associated endoribonuclease Cas2
MKKKKIHFRLGDNEKEIIKMVGIGLFVVASFAFPNLPIALQPIFKMRGNKGFQKLIKQLKAKNIIYLGDEKIRLTRKGKKLLSEIFISELKIVKPKKWDGIWRLVAYDIPEKYKKSRDQFRFVLEQNGFQIIQKSLWVNPYECKEEIAVLAKTMNLTKYVIFLSTDKLPNQEEMEQHFNLTD